MDTTHLGKYFILFADCKLVKGYSRSTIYDLTRSEIHFIPNPYYDILLELKGKILSEFLENLSENDRYSLLQFLDFLVSSELGFFDEDMNRFPEIDEEWDHPSTITNAIIDVGEKRHDFDQIFSQLTDLGCRDVQIRCYRFFQLDEVSTWLLYLNGSSVKSVEILLKFDDSLTDDKVQDFLNNNKIVTHLILHGSKINVTQHQYPLLVNKGTVSYTTQRITSCESCGLVNLKNLSVPSISLFNELRNYNGCLNRKISIDHLGEIKKCPSMKESYGNISTTTIASAQDFESFHLLSKIKKDEIEVCRDCEFRYICTDCRAYTNSQESLYAKPSKCSYDPYTAEWREEPFGLSN